MKAHFSCSFLSGVPSVLVLHERCHSARLLKATFKVIFFFAKAHLLLLKAPVKESWFQGEELGLQ